MPEGRWFSVGRTHAIDYGANFLMDFSLTLVVQWLLHYKYFILFPGVAVEGPVVTIIAGFLSSLGYLNIFLVYGIVVIADLCADSIYYAAGRWGRERVLGRWGRFLGVTTEKIMRLQVYFARHKGKTLIIAKLTHAIGAPILVAAGVAGVRYWEFVGFNFVATLPKSFFLLLIGFYFGHSYTKISRYLDYTALAMLGLAALCIMFWLIMKKISKNFFNKE